MQHQFLACRTHAAVDQLQLLHHSSFAFFQLAAPLLHMLQWVFLLTCLSVLLFMPFPCAVIEPGQGMIASSRNAFSASDCPVNAYGVSAKMYGLNAAPCKPCPRNMITDGQDRVPSSDACINPDGFGYASEGASPGPVCSSELMPLGCRLLSAMAWLSLCLWTVSMTLYHYNET